MNSFNIFTLRTLIMATLAWAVLAQAGEGEGDRTTIKTGDDSSIRIVMKGRGGNLELASSGVEGDGHTLTNYQKGSGYVEYDRTQQVLNWKAKTNFTLNRLSKHIMNVAPYMHAYLPKGSELDFRLEITNVGFGSLNFQDLNIKHFKFDTHYGDIDINFPTENQSIIRDTVKFHVMAGDLEIYNLGNLKASKVKINGGVGELAVDFGPRILADMNVRLDHDIGVVELFIPKGTKVLVSGTSRDLSDFGFQKVDKTWEPTTYSPNSPTLNLRMKGPMGDFSIVWK